MYIRAFGPLPWSVRRQPDPRCGTSGALSALRLEGLRGLGLIGLMGFRVYGLWGLGLNYGV